MSLEVIGAGFGRTGTESMNLALERLGFGPCYHMREVIDRDRIDLWRNAEAGRLPERSVVAGASAAPVREPNVLCPAAGRA